MAILPKKHTIKTEKQVDVGIFTMDDMNPDQNSVLEVMSAINIPVPLELLCHILVHINKKDLLEHLYSLRDKNILHVVGRDWDFVEQTVKTHIYKEFQNRRTVFNTEIKLEQLHMSIADKLYHTQSGDIIQTRIEAFNHFLYARDHKMAAECLFTFDMSQLYPKGMYGEILQLHEALDYSQLPPEHKIKSLINKGMILNTLGEYISSLKELELALSVANTTEMHEYDQLIKINIAATNISSKQYQDAINILLPLQSDFKKDDYSAKAAIVGNLGNTYHQLGELSKALKYNEEYLDICVKNRDSFGQIVAYNNIADTRFASGRIDLAYESYTKQCEIAKRVNDQRGIAYGFAGLGKILLIQNETSEAMKAIATGLHTASTSSLPDRSLNSHLWEYLSIYFLQTGQFEMAKSAISKAIVVEPNDVKASRILDIIITLCFNPEQDEVTLVTLRKWLSEFEGQKRNYQDDFRYSLGIIIQGLLENTVESFVNVYDKLCTQYPECVGTLKHDLHLLYTIDKKRGRKELSPILDKYDY